ncbi:hypothetical protein VTI74DRAFT_7587 [Chaetomium olivicolor]
MRAQFVNELSVRFNLIFKSPSTASDQKSNGPDGRFRVFCAWAGCHFEMLGVGLVKAERTNRKATKIGWVKYPTVYNRHLADIILPTLVPFPRLLGDQLSPQSDPHMATCTSSSLAMLALIPTHPALKISRPHQMEELSQLG